MSNIVCNCDETDSIMGCAGCDIPYVPTEQDLQEEAQYYAEQDYLNSMEMYEDWHSDFNDGEFW